MKNAVKIDVDTSTVDAHQRRLRKVQWRWPIMVNVYIFFQNFEFLGYLWHKTLVKVLMPKLPLKSKFWIKNHFFGIQKYIFFININVDQLKSPGCIFLLVDGWPQAALFITPDFHELGTLNKRLTKYNMVLDVLQNFFYEFMFSKL